MYLLFLIGLCLFIFQIHRISERLAGDIAGYILYGFLFFIASLIPSGYLIAKFNLLANKAIWAVVPNIIALLFNQLIGRYPIELPKFNVKVAISEQPHKIKIFFLALSSSEKILFSILTFGLAISLIVNLLVLFLSFPNEWDSMTGHLVKCAYYLQNGNMDRIHGTTWSIDYYPNSLPTLQIFGYHFFGEKGFRLIHFLSYFVFIFACYSTALIISKSKKGAVLAALAAGLLPSALIQATTTETDMVQTAYLSLLIFLILKAYKNPIRINLYLVVWMTSIWISHKVTFILIGPAVFLLIAFILFKKPEIRKSLLPSIFVFLIGIAIYVLPNGYLGNIKEAGKLGLSTLSAPEIVMKWHGIGQYSTGDKARNFALNIIRYSSDFLQLDGIRSLEAGNNINHVFRKIPNAFFQIFHPERDQFWVVAPFVLEGDPRYEFYKERPFWGVIGFLWVLPLMLILLIKSRKKALYDKELVLVFILAAIIHFLSLSASAPYDPIKGRYFMNMAVWCLPLISLSFFSRSFIKYLGIIAILVVISSTMAISFRSLYPLFGSESFLRTNRIEQLTITRPELYDAYVNFEKLVPDNAIVALGTQQEHEDFEYPLWGNEFKRTLIPLHPFRSAVKPIPSNAEYLFYSEGVFEYKTGDIQLNKGDLMADTPVPESKFFLRKLN